MATRLHSPPTNHRSLPGKTPPTSANSSACLLGITGDARRTALPGSVRSVLSSGLARVCGNLSRVRVLWGMKRFFVCSARGRFELKSVIRLAWEGVREREEL